MVKRDIQLVKDVLVDPEPDERGNVMSMATFHCGRMIGLSFNAN